MSNPAMTGLIAREARSKRLAISVRWGTEQGSIRFWIASVILEMLLTRTQGESRQSSKVLYTNVYRPLCWSFHVAPVE